MACVPIQEAVENTLGDLPHDWDDYPRDAKKSWLNDQGGKDDLLEIIRHAYELDGTSGVGLNKNEMSKVLATEDD